MRRACIDIGSNTTRLLVAECDRRAAARGPPGARVHAHRPRRCVADGDDPAGEDRGGRTRSCRAGASSRGKLGVAEIHGVATAAIRRAANGEALRRRDPRACGLDVKVLSGEEEARLAFVGAARTLGHVPDGRARRRRRRRRLLGARRRRRARRPIGWWTSFALGSGDLADDFLRSDPPLTRRAVGGARPRRRARSTGIEVPAAGRGASRSAAARRRSRRLAGPLLDADAFDAGASRCSRSEPASRDRRAVRARPRAGAPAAGRAADPGGGVESCSASRCRSDAAGSARACCWRRPVSIDRTVRCRRCPPREALADVRVRAPTRGNRRLERLLDAVNADDQVKAWWHVSAVNATRRLRDERPQLGPHPDRAEHRAAAGAAAVPPRRRPERRRRLRHDRARRRGRDRRRLPVPLRRDVDPPRGPRALQPVPDRGQARRAARRRRTRSPSGR